MESGLSVLINRSAEETAKEFQTYLRKYENDQKLVILEAVNVAGSKLGDNYTSIMIRTKLVGKRGDGSPYAKSFMTKTLSSERPLAGFLGLSNLFRNEAHVYNKILPVLGSFGPGCIHFDPNNIIMEDLAERGYVNCDRRQLLDADHIVYALKALAKLHASALAMKINNPQKFNEMDMPLKEVIYTEEPNPQMETCTQMSTKTSRKTLELIEPRTQDMQGVIDFFDSLGDTIYNRFVQMFNEPKKKYHTICHGDPWANNLLYLHDKNGKIIDMKMVDYQICRHTSVATDIHYLIYTSAQSSLIEKSYESLLKIYHNAFLNELRRLRVSEKVLAELGPEWLEAELRAYKLYGVMTGCWLMHAILADDEDAEKFEKIDFQNSENLENFGMDRLNLSKKKLDRLKCITLHYYRRYHLGIIKDDIEPLSITG